MERKTRSFWLSMLFLSFSAAMIIRAVYFEIQLIDSGKRAANMQGSMNTIYYFRHRHHEPTYSWLIVSAEHGPIEDTEKEVADLEIKAQAWEVDHIKPVTDGR